MLEISWLIFYIVWFSLIIVFIIGIIRYIYKKKKEKKLISVIMDDNKQLEEKQLKEDKEEQKKPGEKLVQSKIEVPKPNTDDKNQTLKDKEVIKTVVNNQGLQQYKESVILTYVKKLIRSNASKKTIYEELANMKCSKQYVDYILEKINLEEIKKQKQYLVDILTIEFELQLIELIESMEEVSVDYASNELGISMSKLYEIALNIENRGKLFIEDRGDEKYLLSQFLGEKRILNKLRDLSPHSADYYKKTFTKLDDLGELLKEKKKISYIEAMNKLKISSETLNRHIETLRQNKFIKLIKEKDELMLVLNQK